jgi:hypothetical protein
LQSILPPGARVQTPTKFELIVLGGKKMSRDEFESEVAAFILSRGITRCPTACVVRTQASISPADREALQRRAAEQETSTQSSPNPGAAIIRQEVQPTRRTAGN